MFEGEVGCEEGDDGFGASTSKRVVGEVDSLQRGRVGERVAKGGEGFWNLGDESSGKDIGKVGDLQIEEGASGNEGEGVVSSVVLPRRSSLRASPHTESSPKLLVWMQAHLEVLERRQDLCESLACVYSKGVSSEVNLLDSLSERLQSVQVRLDVLCCVKLKSETMDGEGRRRGGHDEFGR